MRTFVLAGGILINRAVKKRELHWVCGLAPVAVLILSPPGQLFQHFVSLAALLPVVFLLSGWPGSRSRRGLTAILYRTAGGRSVYITEAVLPWIAGTLLSFAVAILVDPSLPWQFWIASPFTVLGFSLLFLALEERFRYPGRGLLFLVWLYGVSRQETPGTAVKALLFTEYPGGVVAGECPSGMHPDSYILASLAFVLVSGGLAALFRRKAI